MSLWTRLPTHLEHRASSRPLGVFLDAEFVEAPEIDSFDSMTVANSARKPTRKTARWREMMKYYAREEAQQKLSLIILFFGLSKVYLSIHHIPPIQRPWHRGKRAGPFPINF